jgi:catechol 2,3-dioxygenase-like lactoylglutathione lyase family enzyme
MKLTFIYQSVTDLPATLAFYRDVLGLDEAWREGDGTVALELPGSPVQLMLDVRPDEDQRWSSGPFFAVDDVKTFIAEHPQVDWLGGPIDMPGGVTASFTDPAGNVVHIFDQSTEEESLA